MYYTLFLSLTVIFHSFGCSSQSERGPHSKLNSGSSSGKQHDPDQTPTEEPPARARSRTPVSRCPPTGVFGCPIEQLGYIRLIPRTNQNLTFEFRRYIFPAGESICWRADGKTFSSVPTQEHIVLSASDGDIFAILGYGGSLCGLHRSQKHRPRAKMNMISGDIHDLTPDEVRDCPVGKNNPIFPRNFIKAFSNSDSLRFRWNSNEDPTPGSSSSAQEHSPQQFSAPEESLIRARSISPPDRPPSDRVLGYTMEHLGHVRLIPCTNLNQQFEFRKYVFPFNKSIRMRINEKQYSFGQGQEYTVLSASNGDVFAILDHSGTLRGIYNADRNHARIKMNMITGAVHMMTPDEKRECPVGKHHPIFPNRFIRAFSNNDSLQHGRNPNSERNSSYYFPGTQYSHDLTLHEVPSLDARASSPPGRPPSHEVLGYSLERLGYIRLIPQMNPRQQYEFRKYIFSAAKGIQLMLEIGKFVSVPTREHIVLSNSNGDVFAILEYTGILRAIYQANRATNSSFLRIRMNMITGEVSYMTEFEMMECPVGRNHPIFPRQFNKVVTNENSLQYLYH